MRLEWLCAERHRRSGCRIGVSTSRYPRSSRNRPQLANDQTSLHEHIAHFTIDDEIDVALPVSDLDVLQAVPLLRQRQKALRQGMSAHLQVPSIRLCAVRNSVAFDADEVADVEQLVQLEVAIRKLILLGINLKLAFAVRQRDEAGFSKRPIRQNAAGDTHLVFAVFQLFGGFLGELL